MTVDEVSGGREPRRWVRPVAVALALLLAAGLVTERVLRSHEQVALRACVAEAESDLDDLAYRTAGLEVYIASAVDRPDVSPDVRKSLRGIVQETVLRGLPPLQRDQVRCRRVPAWHASVSRARRDYLAYLELRVDQVQRAVVDLDALHVALPELSAARGRARGSLARAGVTLSP